MSPEDPNNPGLNTKNPDFDSVPLPEPSPIKSPYTPVEGTLGDIADDVAANDADAGAPQPTPLPTAGIVNETPSEPSAPASPDAPTPASTPQPLPTAESAPAADKPKKKKLPLIIGIIVAALVIVGIVLFLIIAKPFNDNNGNGGGNGGGGVAGSGDSLFTDKYFFISSTEKDGTKYAVYNSEGNGEPKFIYDEAPSAFLAGAALVKEGSKYSLIDGEGKDIVSLSDYKKVRAYGGLYGVEKDGKKVLLNNKGEEVTEYTDENIQHFTEFTDKQDVAYTLLENGEHYTVYNPYGTKVTEFDSKIVPTITTPHIGKAGSPTVIVYGDGAILLDDKGGEIRRIKKNFTKRMFGVFVSNTGKLIGLSSVNEELIKTMGSVNIPDDNRDSAMFIGDEYFDYDHSKCLGLYIENLYADKDEDGFVLCMTNVDGRVIKTDGSIAMESYYMNAANTLSFNLYSNNEVYPITFDSYLTKIDNKPSYSIFYKGKNKGNFVSGNVKNESDSNKHTKTVTTTDYELLSSYNNYIVQRVRKNQITAYSDSSFKKVTGTTSTQSGEIIFVSKEGKKICTFDKEGYGGVTPIPNKLMPDSKRVSRLTSSYAIGFINGVALVHKLSTKENDYYNPNGYTRINDKCEVVGENTYYRGITRQGSYAWLTEKTGKKYNHRLINKDGEEVLATGATDDMAPMVTIYDDNTFLVHSNKKYQLVAFGKQLKSLEHFCPMFSFVNISENYLEFGSGANQSTFECGDTTVEGGHHYYFLPNGKEIYHWKEKTN